MDKYEYRLKLDQMKSLIAEKDYETAAEIADTINWHKIKNVNALIKAGEIYEKTGRYEDSREVLLMAYDKSPIGRLIICHLAEVAVKMGNYEEAKDYYQEFVEIAPHDSLKYVLKYKICKAEGADTETLISILEELKEQEYLEEWAYELACLYHKAGMSERCIEACDELILWFGDGPYVNRALELKMLYQPLTHQQEEKYRRFRQKKEGIIEVRPDDELESGEIVNEPVQIPKIKLSPERFNTQNLQEELQRSMQQIMEATEKETVEDSMDNIKKLVEEIPYLQLSKEELEKQETKELPHIETDEEIDNSLRTNFKEFLAEDYDGQISLCVPEHGITEPQVTGQMSIEDVLTEWEKTKWAAQAALQEAEQRKLESVKAKALQEAGDIMERLVDVIPKLDSGFTPKELLEEQYLAGVQIEDEKAAEMVANMNQILQQEIDRLSSENAKIDEKLAAAGAGTAGSAGASMKELLFEGELPEIAMPDDLEFLEDEEFTEDLSEEDTLVQPWGREIQSDGYSDDDFEPEHGLPQSGPAEDMESIILKEAARTMAEEEQKRQDDELLSSLAASDGKAFAGEEIRKEEILPKIEEPEEDAGFKPITKLTEEQREIFTYFVPIKGMEEQLCQALTGAAGHLTQHKTASTGNMIVQGSRGSGKTVLATSVVKALQKETGKPKGRIGKIEASALNQKDVAALLKKVAGGCLIIERAGAITRETAIKLACLLDSDESGLFIIIEDTHKGIEKALSKDAGFASRFSEKISIPIFTSDELVAFAKSYANELGYAIDEMGVLALYNSISNIQKLDQATTLTEVKDIVDKAVARAEKGGLKKVFSIITSRRYDDEDYVILHEKDFEF